MGVSWDGRGLGKELGNILALSKSPQMHINVCVCVCVLFKSPSHSCREGLLKFMILNECLGVPVINTSVMTAVTHKWIFLLLQHPEAGFSASRLLRADRSIWRSSVSRSEISSVAVALGPT